MSTPSPRIVVAVHARPLRRLIELSLHLDGYRPQVLADGQQALEHLLAQPFDLALLDRQLVPVDGLTICERLRAVTAAPIVLLLLRGEDHDHHRGRQVGVTDFLHLPFGMEELRACVQTALSGPPSLAPN